MEPHKHSARMQKEMIAEVTAANPKYLVFVGIASSWRARDREEWILSWSDQYMRKCYRVVGIAEIGRSGTEFRWDEQVVGYQPKSPNVVFTLRRNSDGPCSVS